MKAGLFLMPSHPPERSTWDAHQWDLDCLELADNLGFSEAWIGEHFTAPWEPVPAPDLLIAQALMRTTNIKLGTGAHLLPFHNPVETRPPRRIPRPPRAGPLHVRHRLRRPPLRPRALRRQLRGRRAPRPHTRSARNHPRHLGQHRRQLRLRGQVLECPHPRSRRVRVRQPQNLPATLPKAAPAHRRSRRKPQTPRPSR